MSKDVIKGFKVFNPDWTCRNKQYTCPGVFEEDVRPVICSQGMHFCRKAADCFNYDYKFDTKNKVAEAAALGETDTDGEKHCTNKLEIIREVSWNELLEIVNIGKGCTGRCNSGDYNSGNYNSGLYNTGNYNSGNYNSVRCNSGHYNSGNCNSGLYNSGNYNSGHYNSGRCNTGNYNSGNYNSGNYNTGDCNSGDFNSGCYANGCFNTSESKIYLFDKPSDWTYEDWRRSEARCIMYQIPEKLQFITFENMTEEEKVLYPEAETTGGYLKKITDSAAVNDWWHSLSEEDKKEVMSIPNFDRDIFKEITGIDIEKDEKKNKQNTEV